MRYNIKNQQCIGIKLMWKSVSTDGRQLQNESYCCKVKMIVVLEIHTLEQLKENPNKKQ